MQSSSRWRRVILIAAGLATWIAATATAQPKDYSGYKVLRVAVTRPVQLEQIERTGAVILDCIPKIGEISVLADDAQVAAIGRVVTKLRIVHNDAAQLLAAQRPAANRAAADPFTDFFLDYRAYDNGVGSIVWYMNELVSRYPNQAEMVTVGTTLEGRTIQGLHITDLTTNATRPAVVYFSCEHAREWITTTVPNYFATQLLTQYAAGDPATIDLVDHVEFYLVPVFNVDGYEYTWSSDRFWRKNRRDNGDTTFGVDINRNWGEGWGGQGSSGQTSSDTYRGPSAFSEPETQVMRDFFINHPNVRAQLDIHSFSQLILWPFAYTATLPADQNVYQDVGFGMQSDIFGVHGLTYTAGPVFTTIYPAAGGSIDWTYAQRGVLSFSFEMRPATGGLAGFDPPATEIIPNNEELMPAVLRLSNSDWVRASVRFSYPAGAPPASVIAGQPTTISVDVVGQLGVVDPASVTLYYRTDPAAAFVAAPLTAIGGDTFQGQLPATNCLAQPAYYISATTDLGAVALDPAGAPVQLYNAPVVRIALADDLESVSGWQVGAADDSAVTGIWIRTDPVGTTAQPENDHTPDPATQCFVTGQGVVGGGLGDNDVDGGKTTLFSPVLDVSQMTDPTIAYWRWFSNDTGSNPNEDVLVVEISPDASGVWTAVETVGPAGAESSTGWFHHQLRVADFVTATASVQLRFVASDTGGGSIVEAAIDDLEVVESGCTSLAGDYDGDGDRDITDFKMFAPCMTGPIAAVMPGCDIFDFDLDGDIDAADHAAFQSVAN